MIRAQAYVEKMAPYALANVAVPPNMPFLSLCQNESLRPPSPLVAEAVARAAKDGQLYPDPEWRDLVEVLGDRHGLPTDKILCGNGSLDLIGCIARTYLGAGCAALAPEHSYPFFKTATVMTGARFDTAAETNLTASVDAIVASVTKQTKLVFLANPANPTGTRISKQEVYRLRHQLPADVILVIDEAYGEFSDYTDGPLWGLCDQGNTIVLRTLSKAYGLAGYRVGWGVFPEKVMRDVRKVMNPNNVAALSQVAARSAVLDHNYMLETCAMTSKIKSDFTLKLHDFGLDTADSFTNFVLLKFDNQMIAHSVHAGLCDRGVVLRPQGAAGLFNCLRATIGTREDMNCAADTIQSVVTGVLG